MARGRRNPAIELDVQPDAVPATNPEETGGEGVASLFDFSGDARVRVLHRNEKTQRYEPHGYFPADATEESVLNEFGGGRYRVQLLVRDDAGREVIKTQRDFDLPGEYRPPAGDLPGIGTRASGYRPKEEAASTAVAPIVSGGDDLMQVLKAGIINTLLEMMKSTKEMSAPRTPAVDPMLVEIMKAQAATQSQMMQFMLTLATKDGGDSKKDMLDLMAKMKELVAPPASANGVVPADPMKMFNNMLETFKSFREAAEDVSPPSDGMGGILSAAPKLIEVISEQHQMQKNAAAAAASQPRAAQQPIVGTIAPQPQGPPPALWQRALREHAGRLVASAAAKHDPDVIAGTAILFAPPALLEAFKIFFHRSEEEVAADVFTEIPLLAEHREWVADFVVAAQERLFPEEFEGEDEPEAAAQ
jgi:hypothetical protein